MPCFESASLGPERLVVTSLTGKSELNQGFQFQLELELPSSMANDELERVLEAEATVVFVERDRELQRFHGIVSEVTAESDVEHTRTILRLELVPRTWLLGQRRGSEIFLDRSVPSVIADKLTAAGFVQEVDFAMPLRRVYPLREFIAQHEETDLAFVSRLCEAAGITTFFDQHEGRDLLVLTDSDSPFREMGRTLPVRHRADHPAAWNVRSTLRRVPNEAQVHDYNYRSPVLSLLDKEASRSAAAVGQWTEFGDHIKSIQERASLL